MKKVFITMVALSLTSGSAIATTTDVLGKIRDFIKTEYSNAITVESEMEDNKIEVDIIHNKKEKTLTFSDAGVWESTKYDIRKSELPRVVRNAVENSEYSSYRMDDIETIQTPTKTIYEIELSKYLREDITILVDDKGDILMNFNQQKITNTIIL